MVVQRLAIVGTGLIGASLGLAARARGIVVRGWDPDPEALESAADRGAVAAAHSLEEAGRRLAAASTAACISASMKATAWFCPIGRPN